MIIDTLSNWKRYFPESGLIRQAFDFLVSFDPSTESGRISLAGDDLYVLVQKYVTGSIDEASFESHRKYLDIHVVHRGMERIAWVPAASFDSPSPYCEENDVSIHPLSASYTSLCLRPGSFSLFFPEDAHAPCCQWEQADEVLKTVVKCRMDSLNGN